jgi:small subunit ribosomal protein S16
MVKLRLTRMGSKRKPYYRIVAIDGRSKRDSDYLELIGTYNPEELHNQEKFTINEELAIKWLNNGAEPTQTVRNLFKEAGILEKLHNMRNKK